MNFGFPEMIVVGIIIIVLFGAKRIPELAKGLGTGIRDFKKAMSEEPEEKETKQKS